MKERIFIEKFEDWFVLYDEKEIVMMLNCLFFGYMMSFIVLVILDEFVEIVLSILVEDDVGFVLFDS